MCLSDLQTQRGEVATENNTGASLLGFQKTLQQFLAEEAAKREQNQHAQGPLMLGEVAYCAPPQGYVPGATLLGQQRQSGRDWLDKPQPVFCAPPGLSLDHEADMQCELRRTVSQNSQDSTASGSMDRMDRVDTGSTDLLEQGSWPAGVTTAMIRNIACRFTQEDVSEVLDSIGLSGQYDAVCVPRSRMGQSNLGYAFVNFSTAEAAQYCCSICHGTVFGSSQSTKTCEVVPARIQGAARAAMPQRKRIRRKALSAAVPVGPLNPKPSAPTNHTRSETPAATVALNAWAVGAVPWISL